MAQLSKNALKSKLGPASLVRKKTEIPKEHRLRANEARFVVLDELRSYLPQLSKQEKLKLEDLLLKEGIRDHLLVWKREEEQDVLLDGHNRLAIAEKHGLDFPVKYMTFSDLQEVKQYMLDLQLGKRNLVKWQVSYLRGFQYAQLKQQKGGDRRQSEGKGLSTSEQLARQYGVGPRTIERDYNFYVGVNALPEEVNIRLMQRRIRISKQFVEAIGTDVLKDPDKQKLKNLTHFLAGKISLEEGNFHDGDDEWLLNFQKAKLETSLEQEPELSQFRQKELNKVKRMIRNSDLKRRMELAKIYADCLDLLEKSI
ncbi:MAG: hypothetical protein MI784_05135 [Cytophagales bacterium]|nr:hypothetical protein [Cytophagales bacterium]